MVENITVFCKQKKYYFINIQHWTHQRLFWHYRLQLSFVYKTVSQISFNLFCSGDKRLLSEFLQPSRLPTAKGNCLQYCHQRENHRQQIFAVDHLFTIRYEAFSILLNKIFSFLQMFTLLRKHSSPDYFT